MNNLNFIFGTGVFTATIGGFWAVITYKKSNKIKAAEIFFNLEKNFSKHIPFLLQIENSETYQSIESALLKQDNYDENDIIIYQKLDSMLRHFTTCFQIKKLNVSHNTLDTYKYYLDVFCKSERKQVRKYIEKYFSMVNSWIVEYENDQLRRL